MPFDQPIYAARRARVYEEMERGGGGVMLLPAAEEKQRNADNEYLFRQDSDYAWLVGLEEPQGAAVLIARGGQRRLVLFVRPKDRDKEIWTGFREGVEGAKGRWGADEAFTAGELDAKLPELVENAPTLWWRLGQDPAWDARVARIVSTLSMMKRAGKAAPGAIVEPGKILHELRLHKAPEEVARIRKAAEITAEGHFAAMREGRAGRREYQVQADIEYAFRKRGGSGNGTSYGTIVAAGANSTVLHYRAGETELRDGDVCLVDAGGEFDLYAADVTRTFPVSGEFTPAQRDLYSLVLASQKEALAAVKPGATIDGIHDQTARRLTEGLVSMGLLKGPVEERIAEAERYAKLKPEEAKNAPLGYRKYFMHRTSHWMGLDVHDVGDYVVDGKPRPLAPGMVLTIEPGLYVAADDQDAPKELRGVGIRIEDDALVTESGCENLTAAVPKEIDEVEAVCVR